MPGLGPDATLVAIAAVGLLALGLIVAHFAWLDKMRRRRRVRGRYVHGRDEGGQR